MIELLMIRQAAVIIAGAISSYVDYKTGFIYDRITIPLIAFGIILNLLEQNYYGIGLGIAVFAIGYALYYTGKLGGGDVKLYTGIALAIPMLNGVFILRTAIFSALAGIVFLSTYYTIKYYRKGIDWKLNKEGTKKGILLAMIAVAYYVALSGLPFVNSTLIPLIVIPLLFGSLFVALEKGIKKEFFLKKIKIGEMEEEEIPALEFMNEKEKEQINSAFKGVLGEKEKKELQEKGVKEILVYRNLPRFGPFIFLGICLALVLPQLIPMGWL